MADNPYAHDFDTTRPGSEHSAVGADEFGPPGPASNSVLAVVSLVLSLICCIPGLGLVGAILGGVALVNINRSGGRLKGGPFALAGIVVGVLITIAQVVGGVMSWQEFEAQQRVLSLAEVIHSGDADAIRARFDTTVRGELTDEVIEDFIAAYEAEIGEFRGQITSGDPLAIGSGTVDAVQAFGRAPDAAVPAQFANEPAVIMVEEGPVGVTRLLIKSLESDFTIGLPPSASPRRRGGGDSPGNGASAPEAGSDGGGGSEDDDGDQGSDLEPGAGGAGP